MSAWAEGWVASGLPRRSSLTCVTLFLQTATPTFDPVEGAYHLAQSVVISTTTPSSSIYYTTDGSTPSATSLGSLTLYTVPVAVSVNETLNALAVEGTLLQQPTVTGIAGNLFVKGATGAGSGSPPNGTFALMSEQPDPLTGSGLFQVNGWNAGALTGFTPKNPTTAQLGYAASGQTSTAQFEGGILGAYINSADLINGSQLFKMMITPQIRFTSPVNPWVTANTIYASLYLQVPTAIDAHTRGASETLVNGEWRFVDPNGFHVTYALQLFNNANSIGDNVLIVPDTAPGDSVIVIPLQQGIPYSSYVTLASDSTQKQIAP
jgi:hypothetical protein